MAVSDDKAKTDKKGTQTSLPDFSDAKIEGDCIIIPLGKAFPGEWIKFKRKWLFDDIDDIGKFVSGTRFALLAVIKMAVDWQLKNEDGALIAFNRDALLDDNSDGLLLLRPLSAERARAICSSAFLAYGLASRPDPLA
jgi:hypothetical protein